MMSRHLAHVGASFQGARGGLKGCPHTFLLAVAIVAGAAIIAAQSSEPQLTILSPGDGAYVSGPTLLRAKVEPIDAVAGVTFFVDGRQACALTRVPYECDWDAGAAIAEH